MRWQELIKKISKPSQNSTSPFCIPFSRLKNFSFLTAYLLAKGVRRKILLLTLLGGVSALHLVAQAVGIGAGVGGNTYTLTEEISSSPKSRFGIFYNITIFGQIPIWKGLGAEIELGLNSSIIAFSGVSHRDPVLFGPDEETNQVVSFSPAFRLRYDFQFKEGLHTVEVLTGFGMDLLLLSANNFGESNLTHTQQVYALYVPAGVGYRFKIEDWGSLYVRIFGDFSVYPYYYLNSPVPFIRVYGSLGFLVPIGLEKNSAKKPSTP